jgi:uncharacterized membrane protein
MKKENRYLTLTSVLAGVVLFILCLAGIYSMNDQRGFFESPGQVVYSKNPYPFTETTQGNLSVQEIFMTCDYLQGLELSMISFSGQATTHTMLVVFDTNANVLCREKLTSSDFRFQNAVRKGINLPKRAFVGKGNRIFLCLYSSDGTKGNTLGTFFDPSGKYGHLYVSGLVNDDVFNSIRNKRILYPGNLLFTILETNAPGPGPLIPILVLIALVLSACVVLFPLIRTKLGKFTLNPATVYAFLGASFGLAMLIITPPLQVPDEFAHFKRSYALSEGKLCTGSSDLPKSLEYVDTVFSRLCFTPEERTSKKEILNAFNIPLNASIRNPQAATEYTLPYIPQALGMAFGQIFSSSPLMLMYLGRLFNMLLAVFLFYMAIRITPLMKWVFFLLAVMPKTLFMIASVSYDGVTLALPMLILALIFRYVFDKEQQVGLKQYLLLAALTLALALCKPPYALISLLVVLIPVGKFGNWKRYAIFVAGILVPVLLAFSMNYLLPVIGQKPAPVPVEKSHADSVMRAAAPAPADTVTQKIDPAKQMHYVAGNIPHFFWLVIKTTFFDQADDIPRNFVGIFGWIDTFLPDWVTFFYIFLIVMAALTAAVPEIRANWKQKSAALLIFLVMAILIELAMYLYASFVSDPMISGVQGRYFISIAVLLLFLGYNQYLPGTFDFVLSGRREELKKAKPALKAKILEEIKSRERMFYRVSGLVFTVFSVVALCAALYALLLRYYTW